MKEIPVRSDIFSYTERLELEGTVYLFGFNWNARMEVWIMNISTSEEEPILLGIPVHVNWSLIEQFKDSRLPPGEIFAINVEEENDAPTIDNFGSQIKLLYKASDE